MPDVSESVTVDIVGDALDCLRELQPALADMATGRPDGPSLDDIACLAIIDLHGKVLGWTRALDTAEH